MEEDFRGWATVTVGSVALLSIGIGIPLFQISKSIDRYTDKREFNYSPPVELDVKPIEAAIDRYTKHLEQADADNLEEMKANRKFNEEIRRIAEEEAKRKHVRPLGEKPADRPE